MKSMRVIILATIFLFASFFQHQAKAQETLSLKDAIQLALEHNALIKQSNYAIDAAQFGVAEQQANYYPNILFRTSVSHANQAPRIPIEFKTDTVLARQGTQNTFIARFELNQMVYDFGQTKHSIEAARYGAVAQKNNLQQQKHEIVVNVKQQYYRSLAYQKIVSIYQSIIPLNKSLRAINEAKLKNGVALSTEVLRSQSDLQQALSDVTMAKNEINKSLDQLAMLTGMTVPDFRTTGFLPKIADYPVNRITQKQNLFERLYATALQNRPDIRQTESLSKQQGELSRVYASQKLPTLMLQSDFSYFGPDAFGYYSSLSSRGLKNYNWKVGLGFTFNIFDGSRIKSQQKQSISRKNQYQEQGRQLRLQIGARIKSILSDLHNLQTLLESNRSILEQTETNLKLVETSFKNGAVPQINYIQAKIPVAQAQANVVKNKYDILQTLLLLEETVGTDLNNILTIQN